MADVDGSNQQRLTYFNEATSPDFIAFGAVASDSAFSADGKTLLLRVELPKPDLGQRYEVILEIRLR